MDSRRKGNCSRSVGTFHRGKDLGDVHYLIHQHIGPHSLAMPLALKKRARDKGLVVTLKDFLQMMEPEKTDPSPEYQSQLEAMVLSLFEGQKENFSKYVGNRDLFETFAGEKKLRPLLKITPVQVILETTIKSLKTFRKFKAIFDKLNSLKINFMQNKDVIERILEKLKGKMQLAGTQVMLDKIGQLTDTFSSDSEKTSESCNRETTPSPGQLLIKKLTAPAVDVLKKIEISEKEICPACEDELADLIRMGLSEEEIASWQLGEICHLCSNSNFHREGQRP